MWPNIIVTVEGRPTAWAVSMTSIHSAAMVLPGASSFRTRSLRISAPPPGIEFSPASFRRASTSRCDRPFSRAKCWISLGEKPWIHSAGQAALTALSRSSYQSRRSFGWCPPCSRIWLPPASSTVRHLARISSIDST